MNCELMERKIKNMNAAHYLICNPYSKLGRSQMGSNAKDNEECFFNSFMVTTNKTYERLARVANVVLDAAMNSVFITGYRGCGKTTFSKLLQALIDSRIELIKFEDCKEEERKLNQYDEKYLEELEERYNKSKEAVYVTLSDIVDCDDFQSIDECMDFVYATIKGMSKYVNFEVGINQTERPVEEKLNLEVRGLIKELMVKGKENVFKNLISIYKCTDKFEIFKNGIQYWEDFYTLIEMQVCDGKNYNEIKTNLEVILRAFNSTQLLCIYTLLNMICADESMQRIFLILDNIDVVFDISTLEDFTKEFALFEENFSEIFPDILETGILKNTAGFYDNIVYIFVMRETSANQISDHFTDRLYEVSDHFDISKDVKKRNIIEKKYAFLEQRKTLNRHLFENVQNIRKLCQDSYINRTIFSLFNNDYKRSISCLATIYKHNSKAIQYEIDMMKDGKRFDRHGARGIVYRLIFNHFKSQRYFYKLELNTKDYWANDFTPFRLVLTYLNNVQPEHNDQFLTDDSDLVSLYELYDNFIGILSPTWKRSQHLLADALWSMYDLRKSETWNHLITFDCVASIKKDDLLAEFKQFNEGDKWKSDINIRITCAGRTYVNFVCTHFEFFACRFTDSQEPLFMDSSLQKDEKGKYEFEKTINEVFLAVVKCCKKLDDFTRHVLIEQKGYTTTSLLNSKLVHRKEDRKPLLHEERIIHQHIGYIEAYRQHLIITKKLDCIDINKKIIPLIENYLALLKGNDLYGESSKELYCDLSECTKYIRDTCNYNNSIDSISRDGASIIRRRKG